MQKGKHQGGQTQGYPPRNYSAYPGNSENPRQYSRGEVPAFHASGTPGNGPGMRGMHHAPPTQPPTPPTSQDIKQPPAHTPPQAHQMPPQSGTQMMPYAMPGTGRGGTQQTQFYSPPRAPPGCQRMAPHARPSVVMSNSAQSFVSQAVVQPVYQGHMLSTQMSGQGSMLVAPPISQPFQFQQPRHQSGAFYPQQILVPQHAMFHYPQQAMYYSPVQPMSRASGPPPSSQGGAPAQPQPSLTLIAGHGSPMISNLGVSQQVKTSRPKKIVDIIDPASGKNILDEMKNNDNTSSRSGESSARQTPQPPVTVIDPDTGRDVINDFKNENSTTKLQESCERTFPQPNTGQKTDQGVAADFATLVAIAARGDHSGSPNSPALQQSSRASNYSENESQPSPDPQGMSTPSVSPSKLDTSAESISGDSQIVENNITYDTNQQTTMLRSSWTPMIAGGNMSVEMLPVSVHPGIMIADDMMRGGPLSNQPSRDYPTVQSQWIGEGNPVSVIISKEPAAAIESPVRPTPERITPVVSALAHGPTVEIGPRPQREHFPALGKGHQQQSPVKRKQRSEQASDQGEGKTKDQSSKLVSQTKTKIVTPIVENKKQPTQPSQESDEYVQSVQTKNNEPKTIIIKKNDSDNSGTKTKSNDTLKNKENNYVETRNSNEEFEDNNSRIKSENNKCEVSVIKESSLAPALEDLSGKSPAEDVLEKVPSVPVPVPEEEVVFAPSVDNTPSNTNGDATEEDDAKSNNQKSKPGNKRPAQSKMRLESKDSRNVEPETPGIDVSPSAPPVPENKNSAPAAAVSNEQVEKPQEDATNNEEKEDLIVATKNEENAKQTTSIKTNDATQAPAASNKVVLKHNYEAGQWSPLNPEGKKKYDRQFIIDLKDEPLSRRKPTNLPNLDLLNDNNKPRPFDRNVINSLNRSHVESLYPPFANKGSSQRGGQAITKRGSQQGKPKAAKPTVVQVSLQHDVKLHETENAWKPTRITENSNKSEEEAKTEELYRRVRGILNKLTPEKFEVLVRQVKELPIDNPTRLEGVIDLVFKKAVDEPSFSVAYAQMCSVLQKMEVPSDNIRPDGKPEPANFRKLLLGRCQQEFEKNTVAELKRDERFKEIKQEKDPEKKKMLQLQFEEEERKIRMRSVGNIRFIGELYKMNMLTVGIMHSCIKHLLKQGDEESLECLCKLLTTIGQGLESKEKATKGSNDKKKGEEPSLNSYFHQLEEIVKNKGYGKVSSRVRFMIQDLIDLRNSKWIPRRNESQPKTIDQIQKEAERENMEKNIALNSHRESNKRQDSRNSIENRKRGGMDSGGWTTIPMSSQQNKCKSNFIEYDKLKLDQSNVEDFSLGNRTQFIWGNKATSSVKLDSNKFAVLSTGSLYSTSKGTSDKDKVNSFKSVEDDVGSSKNSSQQDSRSSSRDSASSKRDDRLYSSANKGSTPSNQPSTRSNDSPAEETDENVKKHAELVLEEYLGYLDAQEATRDLTKMVPQSKMKDFVTFICQEAMEKRNAFSKKAVGVIMNHCIRSKQISKEDFLFGLSYVLGTADDLALDMPLLWTYIAEILVEMCAEEVITFKDIAFAASPIKGSPGVAQFLDTLVELIIKTKDITWLKQKWIQSKVKLSDIISKRDIYDFVKKNKVDFMLVELEIIELELKRMITTKASFDEITAWITENVSEETRSYPSFIRTLMTVLLEASVTKGQSVGSYKLDTEFFSNYEQLIVRYTNHSEELELPCLFAIQAFVHKLEYPQAILHSIFNHLWDSCLIASETFKLWRRSTDPHEQEGHAVCVKSLTSFFIHLDETETEDES